jgi:hypothetical protein
LVWGHWFGRLFLRRNKVKVMNMPDYTLFSSKSVTFL